MGIEKQPSAVERLNEIGELVPGELDEEGNEIDPRRIALLKEISALRTEVDEYLKELDNLPQPQPDSSKEVVSEEAKKEFEELMARMKEPHA